jgi:hypothetical protein
MLKFLLSFLPCTHNYRWLVVEKEHTEKRIDDDFTEVTYHLHCQWCGNNLPLTHAKLNGGVEEFLRRFVCPGT